MSDQNIKLSLLMYASYFLLFGQFFYNSYVRAKTNADAKKLA